MTDIAASAVASTGGGGSDVRANAALESVDLIHALQLSSICFLGEN
jgi:hypothetical protein